jgi:hypothetical protein
MFTQFQYHEAMEAGGEKAAYAKGYMDAHTHFFTFGLNVGQPDCRIPTFGFDWKTTVKPTCLGFWETNGRPNRFGFTSIINWVERPDFTYEGESWGQKNKTFRTFAELPAQAGEPFEIIINRPKDEGTAQAMERLKESGWNILSPDRLIADKDDYRDFIQSSLAEFSITKETYIKSNSGWFSGRSACYLASGKPVLTQDTQWSRYIPAGEGLLACDDAAAAVEAVREVTADYPRHSRKAKELARAYFDSDKVLTDILQHI